MNPINEKAGSKDGKSSRNPWLNPRRKRFWLIVAILVYALSGYFLVPVLLKHTALNLIRDDLERGAHIQDISFNPFSLDLDIEGFEISDSDAVRLAAFDRLHIDFRGSSLFRRAWTFAGVRLTAPWFNLQRFENGDTRLSRLLADAAGPQAAQTQTNSSLPSFLLETLIIEDGSIDFTDQSTKPAAKAGIRDLNITLSRISNKDGVLIPLSLSGALVQGGQFDAQGDLGLFPGLSFSGIAHTRAIPLALGQPYIQQSALVLIDAGEINSDIEISVPVEQAFKLAGTLQVSGLDVKDALEKEPLLNWETLDIDHFELDPAGLQLSRLNFVQPFGKVTVFKDRSTNLSTLVVKNTGPEASAQTQADAARNFDINVGGVRINAGELEFSDLSLPLPFTTRVTALDGSISAITTASTAPASVKLEGQVNEYGLARIGGAMNLLDPLQQSGVTLEFRNLLMSPLSPYTMQFAGYKINEGTLELKLQYTIDAGQLDSENSIVISDLKLGDKVENPDGTSLPLGLAVALLKDANGVIDIDLPVSGDFNDPEFKIGGIIWKAFSNLIFKVASAPFRLLANLVGAESKDLGQFLFLAGRSDLTPPEIGKLAELEKALQQRPQLALEISGVMDPAVDTPALQSARLGALIRERLGTDEDNELDDTMLLEDTVLSLLESLFAERFPDTPLTTLKAEYSAAPGDDPEGAPVLDHLAYATALRDRLRAAEPVTGQDLTDLAASRARAIRTAFIANKQIDGDRIKLADPHTVKSEDGEWVALELNVSSR